VERKGRRNGQTDRLTEAIAYLPHGLEREMIEYLAYTLLVWYDTHYLYSMQWC